MIDDERKRLVNLILSLANMLILSNFLVIHSLADPKIWTLNLTIVYWIIFIVAVVSVNAWIYFSYYKKPKTDTNR